MSLFRKKEKKSMPAFDLREYQPVIREHLHRGKGGGIPQQEYGKV